MCIRDSDTDTFNRWEAAQRLGVQVAEELELGSSESLPVYLAAMQAVLDDDRIDDALKAQMITPPSFDALAQARKVIDVHAILKARKALRVAVAEHSEDALLQQMSDRAIGETDHLDILSDQAMASRALANACLLYTSDAVDE